MLAVQSVGHSQPRDSEVVPILEDEVIVETSLIQHLNLQAIVSGVLQGLAVSSDLLTCWGCQLQLPSLAALTNAGATVN